MFLSIFDVFKIGIGPSSSHTMGPMVAAGRFLERLRAAPFGFVALKVRLHGSLAFTGIGHATDRAVILGLAGFEPETYDHAAAENCLTQIAQSGTVAPPGLPKLIFRPKRDLIFDFEHNLPGHANALSFSALDAQGDTLLTAAYYSIGGGFVVSQEEFEAASNENAPNSDAAKVPFPFTNANQMLDMARSSRRSIAELKRLNETASLALSNSQLDERILNIWDVMAECVDRGMAATGTLPGGLKVKRRAGELHAKLFAERGLNFTAPHLINDWIACYAMAVNEENAAGGRVVTAPTNGAAGVIPAVIRYWLDHVPGASRAQVPEFLLTAAAIGGFIKHNASISGAECGCQAEVGAAAAMAAAGLAAVLGGSPTQIENAAEIALEHHLGMTCDPVKGLVQVPCIERNGLGAIKAVSAASLALRGDGTHFMPLDNCIEAMRQTGADMSTKYKETALGGLAVNVPNC